MMNRLSTFILLSWGWRRLGIAFLAGALAALAQAPLSILPALFIAYPVLFLLIDGIPTNGLKDFRAIGKAFAVGWAFGFGNFVVSLGWLGLAYVSVGSLFGALLPVAVVLATVGLPALLAIYTGLGAAFARLVWGETGGNAAVLAIALTGSDYLRGTLFTGLPWNLPGQVLAANPLLMQLYAVTGPYGASFVVLLIACAPVVLLPGHVRHRTSIVTGLIALALLVAVPLYGGWRFAKASNAMVPGVNLRIVQPSFPLDAASTGGDGQAGALRDFETLLKLSASTDGPDRLGIVGRTHVIWPETAVHFLIGQSRDQLAEIAALLPPATSLIIGAVRAAYGESGPRYFNSAMVFDHNATMVDAYDKVHLVPFGEYVPWPFAGLLRWLNVPGLAGFADNAYSPGAGPHTLKVPGAPPAAALICYEIAFFGRGIDRSSSPGWIITLSDDSWFGTSFGPYQHLAIARLRAIAEGLPVIRAANSGISAIIDPWGRVIARGEVNDRGAIDGPLPQSMVYTPYIIGEGAYVWVILLGASILFLLSSTILRKNG